MSCIFKELLTLELYSKLINLYIRKDAEIANMNARLEDESGLVASLQRKIKELQVSVN